MTPQTVLAHEVPIQASFAVGYSSSPNVDNVVYCGGTAGTTVVEAHGNGFSTIGALAFSLQKTSSAGVFHGCLTLTAPNGDTLTATYDAAVSAPTNANHFTPATGTLTFTGGTGVFSGASGSATLTAVFDTLYPAVSLVPVQGMAFYVVQGKVSLGGGLDRR